MPTFTKTSPWEKSRTQIMKVGNVICVTDFHDLCPRQARDFVANLSRILSQSRRNGIWALQDAGPPVTHLCTNLAQRGTTWLIKINALAL